MGKIIERVRQRNAKRQSMIAKNNSPDRFIAEQIRAQNRACAVKMNVNGLIGLQQLGDSSMGAASLANSGEAKRWNEAGEKQLADMKAKPKARKWWQFW